MVKLVVIDHHESEKELFSRHNNVKIVEAANIQELYQKGKEHVDKDFDLVVTDQDPDGVCSALLFYLNNREGRFHCTRRAFTKEQVEQWEKEDVKNILALDFWPLKYSELEVFEEIIIINPQLLGLRNVSSAEIIYRILPSKEGFLRDISTIGSVCDYQIRGGKETITETIQTYKGLFPELISHVEAGTLDKNNIWDSKFKELSEMFWAPYILKGEEGCEEFIRKMRASIPFTYTELLGLSNNNGVQYLKKMAKELKEVLDKEREHFENTKKEEGIFIFYESSGAKRTTSKFSSMLCDKFPDKIIAVRARTEDGTYKYSLRRRNQEISLNEAAEKACLGLGCQGGGHKEASGVSNVRNPDEFERNLIEEVAKQQKV